MPPAPCAWNKRNPYYWGIPLLAIGVLSSIGGWPLAGLCHPRAAVDRVFLHAGHRRTGCLSLGCRMGIFRRAAKLRCRTQRHIQRCRQSAGESRHRQTAQLCRCCRALSRTQLCRVERACSGGACADRAAVGPGKGQQGRLIVSGVGTLRFQRCIPVEIIHPAFMQIIGWKLAPRHCAGRARWAPRVCDWASCRPLSAFCHPCANCRANRP